MATRNRCGHPWRKIFATRGKGRTPPLDLPLLDALEKWSEDEYAAAGVAARDTQVRRFYPGMPRRSASWQSGLVHDQLQVFDCLEFSPELRWIDILSEIAFCNMDLMQRGHTDWAWLLLNTWLEKTGDYDGLALLRYYAVYRALVRAKVAVLRAGQTTGLDRDTALADAHAMLELAYGADAPPALAAGYHTWPVRFRQNHRHPDPDADTGRDPPALRCRTQASGRNWTALARSGSGVGQAALCSRRHPSNL